MDCFDDAWFCLDAEAADHLVGVVGSQVEVVVEVVLVEELPHQELILRALRLLDQLEPEALYHCLDLVFLDGFPLLGSEVPLVGYVPEEDIVVGKVDVAVVVEGNELISGDLSVADREQRNEVILSLLK